MHNVYNKYANRQTKPSFNEKNLSMVWPHPTPTNDVTPDFHIPWDFQWGMPLEYPVSLDFPGIHEISHGHGPLVFQGDIQV